MRYRDIRKLVESGRCRICGTIAKKRPRAGKQRHRHKCPHGVWCVAGSVNGQHSNYAALGGKHYCLKCVELGRWDERMSGLVRIASRAVIFAYRLYEERTRKVDTAQALMIGMDDIDPSWFHPDGRVTWAEIHTEFPELASVDGRLAYDLALNGPNAEGNAGTV